MTQPKKTHAGIQRKKKIAAPPPEWLELMAQMRQIRLDAGISSKEIGEKLDISITVLSAWETGRRAMHPHDFLAWLEALGKRAAIVDRETVVSN